MKRRERQSFSRTVDCELSVVFDSHFIISSCGDRLSIFPHNVRFRDLLPFNSELNKKRSIARLKKASNVIMIQLVKQNWIEES